MQECEDGKEIEIRKIALWFGTSALWSNDRHCLFQVPKVWVFKEVQRVGIHEVSLQINIRRRKGRNRMRFPLR